MSNEKPIAHRLHEHRKKRRTALHAVHAHHSEVAQEVDQAIQRARMAMEKGTEVA